MILEIWSDIICPWCGLAEHRLRTALERFEHGDEIELVHRSFPVHPELPREGVTQHDLFGMYGMPVSKGVETLTMIEQMAEQDGLSPYKALDRTLGPSDYAHELLAYATEQGKHVEAWHSMFRDHFGNGRNLWTIDQVVAFAETIGLDPEGAREALESRRYQAQVQAEQLDARKLGANAIPFIAVDREFTLPGVQTIDEILEALRRIWAKKYSSTPAAAKPNDGEMCGLDGCSIE